MCLWRSAWLKAYVKSWDYPQEYSVGLWKVKTVSSRPVPGSIHAPRPCLARSPLFKPLYVS
jgi:hypothetical protein